MIQDGIAYWAHAGDSRLYLMRQRRILAQTVDHSKVRKLLDDGKITAEEAAVHPEKNKIYSCLGGSYPPEIDVGGKIALSDADVVLLCTDGFWASVSEEDMTQFLSAFPVLFAVPQLMDRAELTGGKFGDNLTALAINWHEEDDAGVSSTSFISTQKTRAIDHRHPRRPDASEKSLRKLPKTTSKRRLPKSSRPFLATANNASTKCRAPCPARPASSASAARIIAGFPSNKASIMRASNRPADQLRPVRITRQFTRHAEGSVLVEFGETKVICTASVEEVVPSFLKAKARLGDGGIRHAAAFHPQPHASRSRAGQTIGPHPGNPAPDRPQPARRG